MADESLTWEMKIGADTSGAEKMDAAMGKVGASTKAATTAAEANEKQIKRLNFELERMKAPGADEIRKLSQELKAATGHMGGAGKGAEDLTHHIRHEFGQIGHAVNYAKIELKELAEAFGFYEAFEALKMLGEKIFEIGEEMVKSAAKAQRMNSVFAVVQGGKERGGEAREWIEKFSKTSEFSEAENESAFLALRKHGVKTQQSALYMKAAADIAAGSEDRPGSYQEAISAFSRLQTMGRVSMRSLQPLGLGVEDFKTLPQFKGMSNEKISDAMQKQDVNKEELLQLIMAHAHETKIGTRSADNVDLLSTRMAKLEELPERFFKKLGDTRAVKTLADAIGGIVDKLDPDSPNGKRIFEGLEHTFTVIADAIQGIDFDTLAESMTNDVLPAIESMVEMVKPMLEFLEREIRGMHVLHDEFFFKNSEDKAKGLKGFHSNFKREEDPDAPSFLKPLSEQPNRMIMEGPVYDPDQMEKLGRASAAGHAKGVRDGHPDNEAAGAEMSEHTARGVRKHAQIHSPSQLFADLGGMVGQGFADGIDDSAAGVDAAVARMMSIPAQPGRPGAMGGKLGGVGGISMPINISINGGGATAEEIADMAIDKFKNAAPGVLLSALDQMAMQTGSAG